MNNRTHFQGNLLKKVKKKHSVKCAFVFFVSVCLCFVFLLIVKSGIQGVHNLNKRLSVIIALHEKIICFSPDSLNFCLLKTKVLGIICYL